MSDFFLKFVIIIAIIIIQKKLSICNVHCIDSEPRAPSAVVICGQQERDCSDQGLSDIKINWWLRIQIILQYW